VVWTRLASTLTHGLFDSLGRVRSFPGDLVQLAEPSRVVAVDHTSTEHQDSLLDGDQVDMVGLAIDNGDTGLTTDRALSAASHPCQKYRVVGTFPVPVWQHAPELVGLRVGRPASDDGEYLPGLGDSLELVDPA